MCVNACQKHIVQTKAISLCVGVCVCVCTPQKHILAELLSYPSNICYEFGPCPEEHCHMTESPDSPKQSNNPNAELLRSTGGFCIVIWGSVEINHIGADFFLCKLAPWSQSFSSSRLECREHISDLGERNLKFSPVSLTFSLCAKSFHEASGCFRVVVHRVTLFNTFR